MGKHADAWMAKMMLGDRGPEADAFRSMMKNNAVKIIPVGCLHWAFYSISALFGAKRSSSWNYGRITHDAKRSRSSLTVNAWGRYYTFDGIVCLLSLVCLILNIINWFQRDPSGGDYSNAVMTTKTVLLVLTLIIHHALLVASFVSFGFGKRAGKYFANWAEFIMIIVASYSGGVFLKVVTVVFLLIFGIAYFALSSDRDSTYKNEDRYIAPEDPAKKLKRSAYQIERKNVSGFNKIFVKTNIYKVVESDDGKVYAIEIYGGIYSGLAVELCSASDLYNNKCTIADYGYNSEHDGYKVVTVSEETLREKAVRTGLVQSGRDVSYVPRRMNYKVIRARSTNRNRPYEYYAYTRQGPFVKLCSSVRYAETGETVDLLRVRFETGLEAAWRTEEPQTDDNGAYVPLFTGNYDLYIDKSPDGRPYIYASADDESERFPCCSVEEVMNGSKKIYNSDNEYDQMEIPLSSIDYRSLRTEADVTGTVRKADNSAFIPLSKGYELRIIKDILGKPNVYVSNGSGQFIPLCTVESVSSGRFTLFDAGTCEEIPLSSIPTDE